jgi:glycosyltransferase involved in cell wall biosynthesis
MSRVGTAAAATGADGGAWSLRRGAVSYPDGRVRHRTRRGRPSGQNSWGRRSCQTLGSRALSKVVEISPPLTISVVIPALDAQTALRRSLVCTRVPGVERIVVDGGSSDGTPEAARFLKADRVVLSAPGRAHQLQAGYRAARGDVILFLDPDTRLEEGWPEAIARALDDPQVGGGAFRLRFESKRGVYRVIEWAARVRCRILKMPYRDQPLFVRRKLLAEIGGVPQTPIFADMDLAREIRDHGRLALLPECAWTTARGYETDGVFRTLRRSTLAFLGYVVDFDRERVARWYAKRAAA